MDGVFSSVANNTFITTQVCPLSPFLIRVYCLVYQPYRCASPGPENISAAAYGMKTSCAARKMNSAVHG